MIELKSEILYELGPGFLFSGFRAFGEFPIVAIGDFLFIELVGEYAPGPGIFNYPIVKSLLDLPNLTASICFFILLMLTLE